MLESKERRKSVKLKADAQPAVEYGWEITTKNAWSSEEM
jgi:hypothetical protein